MQSTRSSRRRSLARPPRDACAFAVPPRRVVVELEKHLVTDGFKLVIDTQKSRGSRIVDAVTGGSLIDLYSFFASMPVGFQHPHFRLPEVEAELLAAAKVKVTNSDIYSTQLATFVKTFARVAGLPPLNRYFFIEGGALAVENALKAAMDWKVRKNLRAGRGERGTEILHFENAFHGRSGYTLSLTNTDPHKTNYFARFPWPRVSAPAIDFSLPPGKRRADVVAKEKHSEQQIRKIMTDRGTDLAAIILEPIQGEGGDNHFRPEWLQTLRRICDEAAVLLIFDEVQTGMGLTGKMWCCEHFDVRPDLLCFGKKSQVCGVMAGPRLDEVPENVFRLPGRISSTWGGNFCDYVRSTHYLRIIEEEKLVENARRQGVDFLAALQKLAKRYPLLSAVRGRGLMIAFDLPDRRRRDEFWKGSFALGLLILRCGDRSIRLRPALDIPPGIIEESIEIMDTMCRRLTK